MTKAELLADLAARPFVNAVGVPKKVSSPNEWGDQEYQVGIRKRNRTIVNYELIRFVQLHEGTGADVACYLKTDVVAFGNAQEGFDEAKVIPAPVPEVVV